VHAAIDRDDGAGDVARRGRGKESDEMGNVGRLAEIADRDVALD
jgi:hypothetical protein